MSLSLALAVVIGLESMLKTHVLSTFIAVELIGSEQNLSAVLSGAAFLLGLFLLFTLLLFKLLTCALTHTHMLLPHSVDVLFGCPANHLLTHGALYYATIVAAGFGAFVRVIAAVFEAEDATAAVARERKEVLLVAGRDGTVRTDVHT